MASKWHTCEIQVAGEAKINQAVKIWETSSSGAVRREDSASLGDGIDLKSMS